VLLAGRAVEVSVVLFLDIGTIGDVAFRKKPLLKGKFGGHGGSALEALIDHIDII